MYLRSRCPRANQSHLQPNSFAATISTTYNQIVNKRERESQIRSSHTHSHYLLMILKIVQAYLMVGHPKKKKEAILLRDVQSQEKKIGKEGNGVGDKFDRVRK